MGTDGVHSARLYLTGAVGLGQAVELGVRRAAAARQRGGAGVTPAAVPGHQHASVLHQLGDPLAARTQNKP